MSASRLHSTSWCADLYCDRSSSDLFLLLQARIPQIQEAPKQGSQAGLMLTIGTRRTTSQKCLSNSLMHYHVVRIYRVLSLFWILYDFQSSPSFLLSFVWIGRRVEGNVARCIEHVRTVSVANGCFRPRRNRFCCNTEQVVRCADDECLDTILGQEQPHGEAADIREL